MERVGRTEKEILDWMHHSKDQGEDCSQCAGESWNQGRGKVEELTQMKVKRKTVVSIVNEVPWKSKMDSLFCQAQSSMLKKQHGDEEHTLGFWVVGYQSWCCHFVAVRSHAIYLLSLSLSFLICKIDIMSNRNDSDLLWKFSVIMHLSIWQVLPVPELELNLC